MLFILLFMLGFSIPRPTSVYRPLQDFSWQHCDRSSFKILHNQNVYNLHYTYCTNKNEITFGFIDQNLPDISLHFFNYIDSLGMVPSECWTATMLELYEVDLSVLNDRSRFYEWQSDSQQPPTIWGLYDARAYQPGLSSIVLTNHYGYNYVILSHEMAHYWADRLCLNIQPYQSESFASNFEVYYLNHKSFEN